MGAKRRKLDFSDANDPNHDVTLVNGTWKRHASKQILAEHSPVFKNMFYSDTATKDQRVFDMTELIGKEFEAWLVLLPLIYSREVPIKIHKLKFFGYEEVISLLKLTTRLEIKKIIDSVELFFISSKERDLPIQLELADKYNLAKLQEHCFGKLRIIEDIDILKKSSEFNGFSEDLKMAILEKEKKLENVQQINFNAGDDRRHDVTLVLGGRGGRRLHANKQMLADHSPVFMKMFNQKKKQRGFILTEVDWEVFVRMLYLIYSLDVKDMYCYARSLLKMAIRFEIKKIIDSLEQFFIGTRKITLPAKLKLADECGLLLLQQHCLGELRSAEAIYNLEKSPEFDSFSLSLKQAILEYMERKIDREMPILEKEKELE